MADTIRTIQELNAMLSDNTNQDISEQDIRDILVSMNVHTEIGRMNITGPVSTTYTKIPLNTAGVFERGFVADTANNQISGTPVNMKARVSVEVQISTAPPVGGFIFGVFINGVEFNPLRRTFTAAGHYCWNLGVQLSQNDTIDIRIRANSNTTVTLPIVVLRAERIGIE